MWRPTDPPTPARHPSGEACATWILNNGSTLWPNVPQQEMCLQRDDRISNEMRSTGSWIDCGKVVRLWQQLDGIGFGRDQWTPARPGEHWVRAGRRPEDPAINRPLAGTRDEGPHGVLLEVGANVGACTVEILLRTRAKVVAFEPSDANLFFLTRSLRLAAARDPSIASRVVVFPLGLGVAASTPLPIFAERGNAGNTVVGRPASDACHGRRRQALRACLNRTMVAMPGRVRISSLGEIFAEGVGGMRLIKIDARESHRSRRGPQL